MGRLSEFYAYLNADDKEVNQVKARCWHMEVDFEVWELRRRYREKRKMLNCPDIASKKGNHRR